MKFFLLFSLLFFNLFAKDIKSIKFKGLVTLSSEVATTIVGISKGDKFSEAVINKGIKKLFKQGYFKEISVSQKLGKLIFTVKEKPIISSIKVHGFKESDDKKRAEILQLKKGEIFDEKKIKNAKKRVLDYLEKKGYIDSIIEVEVVKLNNNSVQLSFFVNNGREITITSLDLKGAKKINLEKLTSTIANNEAESFGWLWGRNDGKLKLSELKFDPLRMVEVYRQNGFLDVQIPTPILRVDFNTYNAQLSFNIKEGEKYVINSVTFSGNGDIINDKLIKEKISLKKGDIFNISTVRKDIQHIKSLISNLGYAFVNINPNLNKNKSSVDVDYQITPGEKVYIKDVIIVGNGRTLDRVIRRDVYLAPGDLYSGKDLKESRNALRRTGAFKAISIEERRISANSMDLIVHVKETTTGTIQFGGGYGAGTGFSLDATLSDKNIVGSGINTGIRLHSAEYSKNYALFFRNPRLNDSEYSGSANIFIREFERKNEYRTKASGISFNVGKRFTRTFSGSIGYRFSSTYFPYINKSRNFTKEQVQSYKKSSINLGLNFNNTDDFYVPREGIKAANILEIAGVGANAKFLKNSIYFSAYKGLREYINYDLIIRYKTQLNLIEDLGFIPFDEFLYMGGLGTVRGYDHYSLPPLGTDNKTRTFYAKKMLVNSLDLSFPLVAAARLRFALFVDYGYIGKNSLNEEKRGSYGAQIEWFSPLGPIALIFGHAFDNKANDRLNSVEFSIGRAF